MWRNLEYVTGMYSEHDKTNRYTQRLGAWGDAHSAAGTHRERHQPYTPPHVAAAGVASSLVIMHRRAVATVAVGAVAAGAVASRHTAHETSRGTRGLAGCVELQRAPPHSSQDGQRTAAIFDVDGTLYRFPWDPTGGATALLQLFRITRVHHVDSWWRFPLFCVASPLLALLFLLLDKFDRVWSMYVMSSLSFNGVGVATVRTSMKLFLASEKFKSMIVGPSAKALKQHLDAGDIVVLLSASPMQIIGPIAEHFGAHVACASVCQQSEDQQGEPVFSRPQYADQCLVGQRKEELLQHLVARYNIDLARSYAYGDHETDIPVLREVGHPVAVVPTVKMRAHAERNGWPVLGCGPDDEVPSVGASIRGLVTGRVLVDILDLGGGGNGSRL